MLSACAQPEKKQADGAAAADATEASADEAASQLPPLTQQRFYEIMLADIALQRDEPELATQVFLRIAKDTGESWFARRATESALAARDSALLKKSLDLWQELDPDAERPARLRQQLTRFALEPVRQETDIQQIRADLTQLLRDAVVTDSVGAVFLQLNTSLRQITDKIEAYTLVHDLSLPYQQYAEAHYAVALAAYLAVTTQKTEEGRAKAMPLLDEGEEAIDEALKKEPEWIEALQLKALLLDLSDSTTMRTWLLDTLQQQPDKKALWPFVARAYVKEKNYAEAREWFLKVWDDTGADDALIAAAALSMEMRDARMTQELLETVRESGDTEKVNELIKTYARIAEDEGRLDEAIYWYQQVKEDQYWWSIQLHIAQLFERAGRVAEAETWLNDLPAVTIEERVSVVLARSSLYRNHHELDKARELLEHALSVYPDSAEMLANLAIIDELQDKVEDAIARLRQALALSPNDPYIQNALGYTLVDHETEIDEGAALIAKALEKKPTDGAILDSMGWALYRQGKTEEALPYLRKAMRAHPDPEVAAHLGEVLWQLGKFEEARGVWKNGKSNTAKDALIEKTMQRLNVSESADETPNEPPNTP